jgi:hypothetical protein
LLSDAGSSARWAGNGTLLKSRGPDQICSHQVLRILTQVGPWPRKARIVLAPPIWGDETHRLAILSEASELNLYQHLQPPKVSDQFSAVQVRQPMQGCAMLLGAVTDASMRERIRKRLREYRAGALDGIEIAVNRTKSKFSGPGRTNSHDWYRAIGSLNLGRTPSRKRRL